MKIAVTGGTGFVGSHLVELLLERGDEVRCLVLPEEGPRWLEGLPVAFFEGSVTEPASLPAFLEGCDAIAHIAGLTRARTEEEFAAVNVDGAVNLVRAALSLPGGPRHMVAMSSMAASGPCPDGRCLDEDEPQRPLTPYGRSKAALEEALLAFEGPFHSSFIRAPGVYGPRDRDFLQYFRLVRRGLRLVAGDRNVMSLLYVKNLAKGLALCLGNPAAYGQAFFLADEGEWDWDGFSEMVEKALGARTLRVHVPQWAVTALALASEAAKPFMRRPPLLDRHKLLEARQHRWVVSTAKAERLLGWAPPYATRDALAETGKWYLEEAWL
jgi:dihydroflavonol-4-reductase